MHWMIRIYREFAAGPSEHIETVVAFAERHIERLEDLLAGAEEAQLDPAWVVQLIENCYGDPRVFFFSPHAREMLISDWKDIPQIDASTPTPTGMDESTKRRRLAELAAADLRGDGQRAVSRALATLITGPAVDQFAERVIRNGEINVLALQQALQAEGVPVARKTIRKAIGSLRVSATVGACMSKTKRNKTVKDLLDEQVARLVEAKRRLDEAPHDPHIRDEVGHRSLAIARSMISVLLEGGDVAPKLPDAPDFARCEQATLELLRQSYTGDPEWDAVGELAQALVEYERGAPFEIAVYTARGGFALLGPDRFGGQLALLQMMVLSRYLMTFDDIAEMHSRIRGALAELDTEQVKKDIAAWDLPSIAQIEAMTWMNTATAGYTFIAMDTAQDPKRAYLVANEALDELRRRSEHCPVLDLIEAQQAGVANHVGDHATSEAFWNRYTDDEAAEVVQRFSDMDDCEELIELVRSSAFAAHPNMQQAPRRA
ncbi:MAG: hypothetical protein KAS72_14175 [Phycisphaerales bacterium]|nr:hypothetical protein [Phycisphaerales bacterium]